MVDNKVGNTTRYIWLDWMKCIGMYLVVLEHVYGYSEGGAYTSVDDFLLTFHMPLFLIVSGYLSKRIDSNVEFRRLISKTLIVPMILICLINFLLFATYELISFHHIYVQSLLYRIAMMAVGEHSSLGACWFVYTLIIIKIILQYCRSDKKFLFLGFVIWLASYLLMVFDIETRNAIVNTGNSIPFFICGYMLRKYKDRINNYKPSVIHLVISALIVCICCRYNDPVFMYCNSYGNCMLFFVGGIAGTFMIMILSKLLPSVQYKFVNLISTGSILILGVHGQFIQYTLSIVNCQETDGLLVIHLLCNLVTVFILLVFLPIISLVRKHLPILVGYR